MGHIVYRIRFPDGSTYIGATSNFTERRRHHRRAARAGNAHNRKLRAAFAAHPTEFTFEVAATARSVEELHYLERETIQAEHPTLNVVMDPKPLPMGKHGGLAAMPFGPHPSRRAAAKALGVSPRHMRTHSDKTYEELLAYLARPKPKRADAKVGPPDPRKLGALIHVDGAWVTRRSLLPPGVTLRTARKRRREGASTIESLTSPSKIMKPRNITAGGQTMTLARWAKHIGVTPAVIHTRLHSGWTEAQAVGQEPRPQAERREANKARRESAKKARQAREVTYKGVTGSVAHVCRQFGVSDSLVRARLKLGWSLEKAMEEPVRPFTR